MSLDLPALTEDTSVQQEELDRYEGFWISPDGAMVAYEEVTEAHIPQQCKVFVDTSSAMDRPASAKLRSLEDGREVCTIDKNEDPLIPTLNLKPPELFTVSSKDPRALNHPISKI
eukprot:Skav222741  [mRNA]  locus=scaffold2390:508011:513470:- [translate_table: standard]